MFVFRKQTEESQLLVEKLKLEKSELEQSQQQLKQLRLELRQKDATTNHMVKEHAAAAKTIAEANDLVVQLTERLQEEEQQKFELCERLIASEEKLAERQAEQAALTHARKVKSPANTTKYMNPVAERSRSTTSQKKFRQATPPRNKSSEQKNFQSMGDIWDFRTK